MPAISCIMPCYNAEEYVGKAIESILNQTFSDFEFIIIDDGSVDGTPAIIEEYSKKDERIVYLQNEANMGASYSKNRCIAAAQGKYAAIADASVISEPELFEKEFEYLENNEDIGAVGTNYSVEGDGERETPADFPSEDKEIKLELLHKNPISAAMVRKSVMDKNSIRYEVEYDGAEDFELWQRIAKVAKFHNLPDVLIRRKNKTDVSTELPDKTIALRKIFNNALKDIVAEDFNIPVYENPEDVSPYALRESFRVLAEIPLMRLKEDFPFTRAELGMAVYKQREIILDKTAGQA